MTTTGEMEPPAEDAPARMKPKHTPVYVNAWLTFSGRERFALKRLVEVTPSHDRGVDYFAVTTHSLETAEKLPVGAKGRLIFETQGVYDGKGDPRKVFEDPRTFRVVSNLPGGGFHKFAYFHVVFASAPEDS